MIAVAVALIAFIAGTAGAILLIKHALQHLLSARDAEWRAWAMSRGITEGFPGYGWKEKP